MSAPHLLRVRCLTWDQVEAFYAQKLRRGRLLTMRVPFEPTLNEALTMGLELPNQMVIAIDGSVTQVGERAENGKVAVEFNLHGLTPDLLARLKSLVADGRASADVEGSFEQRQPDEASVLGPNPVPDGWLTTPVAGTLAVGADGARPLPGMPPPSGELPAVRVTRPGSVTPLAPPPPPSEPVNDDDDTELGGTARAELDALDGELRRLRELAAHEVLGVAWDAGPDQVRAAWIALGRRFHPDVVAKHRARILRDVSEELTIHVNRAYDRMRAALVADGRAVAFGPALHPARGWLIGWEDVAGSEVRPPPAPPPHAPPRPRSAVRFESAPLRGEDLFGDLALEHGRDGGEAVALPQASRTPGQSFERQARGKLAEGDHAGAREILAAALHVYPRNQALRALYHVASAMDALDGGQAMLATSQLEAALTQDPECKEAAAGLEALRGRDPDGGVLRRLFR